MSTKEYRQTYYQEHKEKWKPDTEEKKHRRRVNQKNYVERNKDRLKIRKNKWISDNFEWSIWSQAKRRAKRQGIEFTIKVEDVIIPEVCPYLGWPLTRIWGKGRVVTNASIDRIDSKKGYTPDNIKVMSRQANEMKRDTTTEELIKFCQGVLKTHGVKLED